MGGDMQLYRNIVIAAAAFAVLGFGASSSVADTTIKVGMISSYSGLNGEIGPVMEKAMRLYMKEHPKDLPPGVKVEIVGSVRVPVVNPDFAPFLQRVKDTKPDALMVFVPAGTTATAVMKGFGDLGLKAAGVKLIGPGDITDDMYLDTMGDVALGVTTVFHYSDAATRPANKAFVAAWRKAYGTELRPNFVAVGAWDSMDAIYYVIREQKGKIDPDKTMDLLKHYKNANSPRGPI